MVGGQDDRRVRIAPGSFQLVHEPSHYRVGGVRTNLEEEEVPLAVLHPKPPVGGVERRDAVARGQRAARGTVGNLGVEERKPSRDAGVRTQQERRHRGASAEAAIAQLFGDRADRVAHDVPAVVADAVFEGKPARQERGVRRQRLR